MNMTGNLTFGQLQREHKDWVDRNFPDSKDKPQHSLLGLIEEIGELGEVILNEYEDSEVWITLPGYEGVYEISDYGRIRRSQKLLTGNVRDDGYMEYCLSDTFGEQHTHYAHILVASAWLGEKPDDMEINHRDGNKANNRVWNLQYVTHSDNCQHAVYIGVHKIKRGANHNMARLSEQQVIEIKELWSTGNYSRKELQNMYGVSKTSIANYITGRSWQPAPDYSIQRALIKVQTISARLAHLQLKGEQGIRHSSEEIRAKKIDAIGDIIVYLTDYATKNGIDLQEAIETTWEHVSARDWTVNRVDGSTP